jgi:hypothetical protein
MIAPFITVPVIITLELFEHFQDEKNYLAECLYHMNTDSTKGDLRCADGCLVMLVMEDKGNKL